MNEPEYPTRVQAVLTLSEVLGKKMSTEAVAMFVKATLRIPADKFAAGVSKASSECRYMPTPSELQELSGWRPSSPSAEEVNAAWRKRWGDARV